MQANVIKKKKKKKNHISRVLSFEYRMDKNEVHHTNMNKSKQTVHLIPFKSIKNFVR